MAKPYYTTEYSVEPDLVITLERKPGDPIDLTNAISVSLIIQRDKGNAITNTGHQAATFFGPRDDGQISYSPQSGDWAPAGNYTAQATIVWPGGPEVIPEKQPIISEPQLPIS